MGSSKLRYWLFTRELQMKFDQNRVIFRGEGFLKDKYRLNIRGVYFILLHNLITRLVRYNAFVLVHRPKNRFPYLVPLKLEFLLSTSTKYC